MKNIFLFLFAGMIAFASESLPADEQKKFDLGKDVYYHTCVSCHGEDGKAQTDMQLLVKPKDLSKTLLDLDQTYKITKYGAHHFGAKTQIMPAFKDALSEKELHGVAFFIQKHFNTNRDARITAQCEECEEAKGMSDKELIAIGKKHYNKSCKFCHGKQGHGDGMAATAVVDSIFPYDLTKNLLSEKQMFLYVKYGGHRWGAASTDMPGWTKKYDDIDIRGIVRYIAHDLRGDK